MNLRLVLSRLETPEARRSAAQALAVVSVAGYLLTLVVMFASGAGLRRWFLALLVWTLFIYVPLRILLEAFQTIAPGIRRTLIAETAGLSTRYGSRASIELMVDGWFDDEVLMPRIATPIQGAKAREGATAVLVQTRGDGAMVKTAAIICLSTVERWVTDLATWAAHEAAENIQTRWADLRALVALAALTKVLLAASADRSGGQVVRAGTPLAGAYLDACLDYCDMLALEVDVTPWIEPPLHLGIDPARGEQTRTAWRTFCDTASPALEARRAVVESVLGSPVRP